MDAAQEKRFAVAARMLREEGVEAAAQFLEITQVRPPPIILWKTNPRLLVSSLLTGIAIGLAVGLILQRTTG